MGKRGSLNITTPVKNDTKLGSRGRGKGDRGIVAPNGDSDSALQQQQQKFQQSPPNGEQMEEPVSAFRSILPQILAVNVKNVLLFGYGMTLGFPTILIPAILGGEGRESTMDNKLHLSKEEISWLSSINLICVPLGCIFSGSLAQPLGRRRAMQFVNIPMLAAWLCFHFSTEVTHLYAGLCLAGLSGGLLEAPVLTYVAEVTTPRVRGLLAASGSFCAILGVFVQFILGTFLKWRLIALISVAVPIVSFFLLFLVPESPHWLIQKNRLSEAMESLAWLRGWVPVNSIREEYEVIYANVTKNFGPAHTDNSCSGKLTPYKQRSFLWPYTIITICFFIGHFSGMTTLQTYAVQIFHTLKAPIDKYYATMLLGLAELMGTFICILLVHQTGKRPIVLASTIGCGLCFLGTATYAYFLNEIPGASISNVVANSSDILSKPLHAVVSLNGSSFSGSEEDEEYFSGTTTIDPYEYPFLDNSSSSPFEFLVGSDSMMDLRLATEQEPNDSDGNKMASAEFQEDQGIFGNLTNRSSNRVLPNNGAAEGDTGNSEEDEKGESPAQGNLPETFLLPVTKHAENRFLWVPLTLLLGSAVLSHCGIRLIPWMLIGEIYPTAVRGGASGLSGGTGYIFGFLSNKLFLKLLAGLTLPGTFWLYSAVSLLGAVVLYFILPETEGRSLVDIEEHFTGGRTLKESRHPSRSTDPPTPMLMEEGDSAIRKRTTTSTTKASSRDGNMLCNRNWGKQSEKGDMKIGPGDDCEDGQGFQGRLCPSDDGLKGNFRRSSCKVSNAANRQICPPVVSREAVQKTTVEATEAEPEVESVMEMRNGTLKSVPAEPIAAIGSDKGQQGVVILVPDKCPTPATTTTRTTSPSSSPALDECRSIGNTLPPITNPLEVQSVNPRIYVQFCGGGPDQTIDVVEEGGNCGDTAGRSRGTEDSSKSRGSGLKFIGSERKRTNSRNDKLFEEAVQQREGDEWLRRIKDAHVQQDLHDQILGSSGLGMKKAKKSVVL